MRARLTRFAAAYRGYRGAVREAWASRERAGKAKTTTSSAEFLPAHLELIEKPVSPTARASAAVLIAFICIGILWSIFGTVDVVAVAPGRTISHANAKVVQPAEIGVVREILVRDGQRVTAGEALIRLDATAAGAELEQANAGLASARGSADRLGALAAALDGAPPVRTERESSGTSPTDDPLLRSQLAAYLARRTELEAGVRQRASELHTVEQSISPLRDLARISAERERDYAALLEGHYVGRHDFLQRQQERIAAERDIALQLNHAEELRSSLVASRQELSTFVATTLKETLDGEREARDQVRQYAPASEKAKQRDASMTLVAPCDGTVQQLAIHSLGGVVTPAQALMVVVPSGDSIDAEATILNKDVGFLFPGQQVNLKIESYPYTKYGFLTGVLEFVSKDSRQDEHLGLVYDARIRITGHSGGSLKPSAVTPGMTLTAEVKTGRRRLIDFLLSPLSETASEALRER